jgi:tRNA 2-thiouridine synthesizing protein A
MSETILRLQGLKCPLPALRTRKALSGAVSGAIIVVECTDPLAAIDIPALVTQTGDVLEFAGESDAVLTFRIRKQ